MTHDIKTLRRYRKQGIYLTHEERVRLCKEDSRRLRRIRRIMHKAAWIALIAAAVMFIMIGGYLVRGKFAIGSEIFTPWVLLFTVWIRCEDKKERANRKSS